MTNFALRLSAVVCRRRCVILPLNCSHWKWRLATDICRTVSSGWDESFCYNNIGDWIVSGQPLEKTKNSFTFYTLIISWSSTYNTYILSIYRYKYSSINLHLTKWVQRIAANFLLIFFSKLFITWAWLLYFSRSKVCSSFNIYYKF